MKRLIIIGEGQTEQAFCQDLLQPHFFQKGIIIQNPTIKSTRGGIANWATIKKQIENHLLESDVRVTTLIDYYGIKEIHEFPGWIESNKIINKSERMKFLELAMQQDLSDQNRHRFIPYIQLHEFEALLFCDEDVFLNNFEESEILDKAYLKATLQVSPEDINEGRYSTPSKRMEKIIKGYKTENNSLKIFYGSLLTQEIGLSRIREKCPRFNTWINMLEQI